MSKPRVAVLHHARSFFPLDLFERTHATTDLIWVLDDAFVGDAATARLLRRLGSVVDIAGLDDDAAAARVAQAHPDGILSFVDDQIPRAAELAARLGLRYHSPALAHVFTDKAAQRAAFAGTAVPQPWFVEIPAGTTPGRLRDLASRIGFPCIVKPVSGMGSRGIHLLHAADDLLELAGHSHSHVVEEYLVDRDDLPAWAASYLSVETVVVAGVPRHVALTGRFPVAPPFRECGNFIPAVADDRLRGQLHAIVDEVVRVLGVRDSVLHTEIKLTPAGPRLIEINGRLGGRPGFVLAEVCDVNMFEIACAVAAGRQVDVDSPARTDGVGFWLMMQPPVDATAVRAVAGLDEAAALPGVRTLDQKRYVGQSVDWREGTDGQVLTLRGAVADHAGLGDLVRRVHEVVRFEYDRA